MLAQDNSGIRVKINKGKVKKLELVLRINI